LANTKDALARLKKGEVPGDREILQEISVGSDFIMDFWKEKYFAYYLARGG